MISGAQQHLGMSLKKARAIWDTPELKALQDEYSKCKRCKYMCYIFYSVHGNVLSNIQVAQDQ